ncbi:hypothetical protein BSL78_24570 [Apostichopus japonicus]|uniref:Pol-like protein n=1 Tax=Stichopus japonicus TaxID=307972 RepID=A0A2G8JS39_STIJA|nr:hypothetical protein BSL78_24570 [Apostichopus japonicus]
MEVDCVCLQETHILEEDVPLWAYEWGGGLHASFGSSSSCGTVILLSPRQAGCATRVETDHEGRLVCILFKYPQARFVLPSIFPIGRGLWKLNCRILGEAEFRQGFETRYKGWQTLKPAFASTSQWWDDVKLRIKRYAIQYCVTRARRRREKFSKLCAEVKFGDPSAVIALQTYLDEKYHGARVRARVEAVEAEERPSLRFYQSVAHRQVTDASRLCALLMGPWLVTLTALSAEGGAPGVPSLSPLERDSRLVPFVVPGGAKVKCAQYADDVTCVVSSLGSFRALSQDLSIFERATGAKLNPEKTKGLRLGSWRYRDLPFGASWSDHNIKINGIWFGYDAPGDVTWSERAEVFESRLETFGTRWLSILGKVTVVNRFVSPILWYPGAVYPIPRRVLVRLERAIFSFIWSGGTELVKRAVMYQKLEKGGLGWFIWEPALVHSSLRDRALNAIFVQGRHPVEVWRSVHSRLNGCRLRDLAWRIAHGALVTNLKRYHWRLGDGLCPRTGCDSLESTAMFFGIALCFELVGVVSVLDRPFNGDRSWSVGQGFVLYGLDPPVCSVAVLQRIIYVCSVVKKLIWRNRCDVVFRGKFASWQAVLEAVKSDIRLQVEGDFRRLSRAAFFGRWCAGEGCFVSLRAGRPFVVF